MKTNRNMTDRAALNDHRRRALASNNPVMFIHENAAIEFKARLKGFNENFNKVAVITGYCEFWADEFPGATVLPDSELLNLETERYDLIVHAMALHWSDDPIGQLIQCRLALKPGGMILAASLGGETLSELRHSIMHAEIAVKGGVSPRIAPMNEVQTMGELLQRAGCSFPVVDKVGLTATYESVFHLMRDLRMMGETNALSDRAKLFAPRALFSKTSEIYSDLFQVATKRVRATFELIFLTARAPGPAHPPRTDSTVATPRIALSANRVRKNPASHSKVPMERPIS